MDFQNMFKSEPRDPREIAEKFPNIHYDYYGPRSYKPCVDRYPGVDRYLVRLTREELAWAEHLAQIQHEDWERSGARYTMETSEEIKSWAHVIGARGEITVAKLYNLELRDYLGRFSPCPDFGPRQGPGICVRATTAQFFPRIRVLPKDGDRCVAVCVCEFEPGLSRVHAWCWIRDAKKHVPLTNPKPFGDVASAPVHLVPMGAEFVNHLGEECRGKEIPQKILDLCPKGYRPWQFK